MSTKRGVELLLSAQSCSGGGSVGFAGGQKRFKGCLQLHGWRCSRCSLLFRQSFMVLVPLDLQGRVERIWGKLWHRSPIVFQTFCRWLGAGPSF